eukprot:gene10330-12683_t
MSLVLIVMGVSGCGKTSIGIKLSESLHCRFDDGDKFHSEQNKEKMRNGIPLTDEDRAPWLETIHSEILKHINNYNNTTTSSKYQIFACSALKQKYRDTLSNGIPSDNLKFIFLYGDQEVIKERLEKRSGHFFNNQLLKSQIDTLEIPSSNDPRLKQISGYIGNYATGISIQDGHFYFGEVPQSGRNYDFIQLVNLTDYGYKDSGYGVSYALYDTYYVAVTKLSTGGLILLSIDTTTLSVQESKSKLLPPMTPAGSVTLTSLLPYSNLYTNTSSKYNLFSTVYNSTSGKEILFSNQSPIFTVPWGEILSTSMNYDQGLVYLLTQQSVAYTFFVYNITSQTTYTIPSAVNQYSYTAMIYNPLTKRNLVVASDKSNGQIAILDVSIFYENKMNVQLVDPYIPKQKAKVESNGGFEFYTTLNTQPTTDGVYIYYVTKNNPNYLNAINIVNPLTPSQSTTELSYLITSLSYVAV